MTSRRHLIHSVAVIFFVLFPFVLFPAGLVSAEEPSPEVLIPVVTPRMCIVFIGGMDSDPTPGQINGTATRREGNSGLFRLCNDMRCERIHTEYFNWNGTRAGDIANSKPPLSGAIVDVIRDYAETNPTHRLSIVGNSWGGHTAWQVCDQLYRSPAPLAVDHVVFLDPSSTGRSLNAAPKELPRNVNHSTNYFTRNLFVWRKWIDEPRLLHIDLGDPKQGFIKEGMPSYAAPFSFPAHVAAEWDELIHEDIRNRLETLIRDQTAGSENSLSNSE